MSGDLKNPSEDIPKGTLRGIVVTYITYVALLWIIGLSAVRCADGKMDICKMSEVTADNLPTGGLLYNKLIMESMVVWGPLVYIGVIAATLSSALASIVGAPRILQSLAADGIFPWPALDFFAKGHGAGNELIRGYILTFVVATACCLIGQLDIIAPIISNFFMISYATTNYACFAASDTQSPGWRTSFKYYNKWLSLFGAILCVVAMFAMGWQMSLVAVFIGGGLYTYLWRLDPETNWGPAGEAESTFGRSAAWKNCKVFVQTT